MLSASTLTKLVSGRARIQIPADSKYLVFGNLALQLPNVNIKVSGVNFVSSRTRLQTEAPWRVESQKRTGLGAVHIENLKANPWGAPILLSYLLFPSVFCRVSYEASSNQPSCPSVSGFHFCGPVFNLQALLSVLCTRFPCPFLPRLWPPRARSHRGGHREGLWSFSVILLCSRCSASGFPSSVFMAFYCHLPVRGFPQVFVDPFSSPRQSEGLKMMDRVPACRARACRFSSQ